MLIEYDSKISSAQVAGGLNKSTSSDYFRDSRISFEDRRAPRFDKNTNP
jgi:hypothetical protein